MGDQGFTLTPDELKVCHKGDFRSLSKKKQDALPPVMPGRFIEICPEVNVKRRWEKIWKQLHKHEWQKHKNLQAIHRFNFGSHVPIHDTRRPIRDFKCHLCLQEVNSTKMLHHLYNECGQTKKVWELLGIQTPVNSNHCWHQKQTLMKNYANLIGTLKQSAGSTYLDA